MAGDRARRARATVAWAAGALPLLLLGASDPAPRPFHFAWDVLPWLQKLNCSSAYCHGGATGRGGFKLSLFGSDASADWEAIVAGFAGRRVDQREPAQSLLLQKPSLGIRHGGGRRLPRGSAAWRALEQWIAGGARWSDGAAIELVDLRLVPRADGFRAEASFAAGGRRHAEDVSAVALWSSTDPRVAEVGADGSVTRHRPGTAWIVARLRHATARAEIVQPFATAAAPPSAPHPLDRAWLAHLARLGLEPAPAVEGWRLARRLHLDLAGRPPLAGELPAAAAATDAGAMFDRLCRSDEFVAVWTDRIADWFELPPQGAPLRVRIAGELRGDASIAAIARMLLAEGSGWLERHEDPRDRAELVARSMLGFRVGCARCHDHPLDRWRMDEHLAFSACFARPRPAPGGAMTPGELFAPDGSVVAPRLLPLGSGDRELHGERRAEVTRFLLDPSHEQFARNVANRLFAALFGRGLVEPIDDHRTGNPAVAEPLLAALAAELAAADYELRPVLRRLVTSRLYAANAAPADDGVDADRAALLARRSVRALTPAQWARAVAAVTGAAIAPPPESPLARELAVLNGELLHELLARGTRLDVPAQLGGAPEPHVDWLYRTLLSRPPRAAERELALAQVAGGDTADWRALAYALLAGREFAMIR